MILLLVAGCGDSSSQEPADAEPVTELPPLNEELSVVDRVSIVRVSGVAPGKRIGWGTETLKARDTSLFDVLLTTLPPGAWLRDENKVLPVGGYDVMVSIETTTGAEAAHGLFVQALEKSFGLEVVKSDEKVAGYELHASDAFIRNYRVPSTEHGGGWATSGKGYKFDRQTMDEVAHWAAVKLGTEVVNQVESDDPFTFEIEMSVFQMETMIDGMADLGLELRPTTVPALIYRVRKASRPETRAIHK